MRSALAFLVLLGPFVACVFEFQAEAAPAGPLIKHLSSLVKWTRSSSKTPHQSDSRARLVAGSFQGHTGHVDGKPSDARFNHPKGVTMDDKGNVYVADTSNLAVRKIGEAGVTTIAGGKSNVAGYRDGPSEDAKFSNDFDVIYVRPTCSLLVIDRGNAALRQISLNKEDCDYENSSVSPTDLYGCWCYLSRLCFMHAPTRIWWFFFSKMKEHSGTKIEEQSVSKETPTPVDVTVKEEQEAAWPSFGQLVWDLAKLAPEALAASFFNSSLAFQWEDD
ncbi:UNVERIFIED_CONTAM: hypothetical protein Sradi_7292600 [Sesamum radiatum]|uniref:NHL repeat-containing protein n=1 Tax=Sesamum radiatum TaxID=300843 RepID=A0AAW2IHF7_SESRA